MAPRKTLTAKEYLKSFRNHIHGITAVCATALPLGSWLIPSNSGGAYLFPPIGDSGGTARIGFVVVAVLVMFLCFFVKEMETSRIHKVLIIAPIVSLLGLFAYLGLHMRFVRQIPVPSRSDSFWVSIGYERTALADREFGAESSDWDMLRGRGPYEEQISLLWTQKSLLVTRLSLLLMYALFLLSAVAGLSVGVVRDLKDKLRE